MEITSETQKPVFDLLFKYWVDQESYFNIEQEISYMDPRDLGYFDKSIEAKDIAREITNTDPALFENSLAEDWQEFINNR